MEQEKVVLELLHDMIELILTPREYEVYTLYASSMKPRYIARRLGTKPKTVRNQVYDIKQKIKNHENWLKKKVETRGLAI